MNKPVTASDIHEKPAVSRPEPGRPGRSATFSGTSINDLMNKPIGIYDTIAEDSNSGKPVAKTDPAAAEKIEASREKFIERLKRERPRLAVAFSEMKVAGNKITVHVPTPDLREEILRNRTDILTLLSITASLKGYIELEVVIKEDTGPKLPVRVEDKLQYLTEKNPNITLLRQKLDMDIE